ncbi:MAG: hypothetical protein Q8865_06885 [Bacillota bacterium]|nr:hypothetical protein [Bacillota bacterium]
MGSGYYIFAFFIFILVCVLIFVYSRLVLAHKGNKNDQIGSEREKSLFKLYQNIEEMMDTFENYVTESMARFDEEKKEISGMLDEVKKLSETAEKNLNRTPAPIEKTEHDTVKEETTVTEHKKRRKRSSEDTKIQKALQLYRQGAQLEDIAKELQMSFGEIQTIISVRSK